jgi:rhodanese-related sulfurtransferase
VCYAKIQTPIIIDVRTAEEWAEGVVKSNSTPPIFLSLYTGSARIFNENFIDDFKALELPKDMTLLFLCKSGGRSAMAAELVSELGYTKCINIIDGFAGWRACNLPIDNESIS